MAKFEYGSYDPSVENGVFTDSTYTNPANETETRKQLSYPLEEVKNQINKMLTSGNDSVLLNVTANSIQYSTNDGASWTPITVQSSGQAVNGLPAGGTNGQYLTKNGSTNYSAQWTTLPNYIPTGGTSGQYLAKNVTGTNYSLKWVTPPTVTTYSAGAGIKLTNGIIANTLFDVSTSAYKKENVDLNTILDPGVYYAVADNTTVGQTLHYPIGLNGILIVLKSSSKSYRQFFFRVGTANQSDEYWYSREINTESGVFGNWHQFFNSRTAPSTVTVASGDRLVVTDSSDVDSIKRSNLAFDGTTTTQYLTRAGTWKTPAMKLLWSNANITQEFPAQTIANSVTGASAYNVIYIEAMMRDDNNYQAPSILVPKGYSARTTYGTDRTRLFTFNSNGNIVIGDALRSDGDVLNTRVIPYRIWGIG